MALHSMVKGRDDRKSLTEMRGADMKFPTEWTAGGCDQAVPQVAKAACPA